MTKTNACIAKWDWVDYCFAGFFWLLGAAIVALAVLGSIAAMHQGVIL